MSLLEDVIRESISIRNGSLAGAMAESDLDREEREHHPYNWAAESFAKARVAQDWEMVPETSDEQAIQKKAKKLDLERAFKRYINSTIVYNGSERKYKNGDKYKE